PPRDASPGTRSARARAPARRRESPASRVGARHDATADAEPGNRAVRRAHELELSRWPFGHEDAISLVEGDGHGRWRRLRRRVLVREAALVVRGEHEPAVLLLALDLEEPA